MGKLTPQQVLDLELDSGNDAGADTVREYLALLAAKVVEEDEGFSGKRPFGNSGWCADLHKPLVKAGVVAGSIDEDGYVDVDDWSEGDRLLVEAARAMGETPPEPPKTLPTKCGFCPQVATRRLAMNCSEAAVPEAEIRVCVEHSTDGALWLGETVHPA